jgi:tetratricopeptide (TPR) repeat protein
MMRTGILLLAALTLSISPSMAQETATPAQPQSPASLKTRTEAPAPTATVVENVNADLIQARADNKDKHYEDAEARMHHVTSVKPELIYPWIELGLAQLGLKKYDEAEASFKVALGADPASLKLAHSEDFYQQDRGTQVSRNTASHDVVAAQKRTPDIEGICNASLGEIYIRQNKIPEAKDAFDKAVKANPTQAALYLRNEATFFFQVGNGPEQVAAADKAIAIDPTRAILYYFKGQGLTGQATVDPKTQKLTLPPGCADAYQKYLQLEPNGQFAPEAKGVLTAAGVSTPGKPGKS